MGSSKVNYLTAKIFMLQQSIINSVYLFVDDVASLKKHLPAGNHNFTKISSTLDKELEQQEVQNLLTTPEPIHDVQLQLVGYKQEKDDKGEKRSLNICPTTPERIKSIYDGKKR
ncbi:hypothetical protein AVEN_72935-1 [Araneus ventricosus]|uniref:Uncharacterized protein n=1 Tax=Araneus ventricosus TaxID=182803 RepID=A0A4Y2PWG7_ARAVE|nr:hypothetical protein AVEN_72935-1 [Araneus ventricosus]